MEKNIQEKKVIRHICPIGEVGQNIYPKGKTMLKMGGTKLVIGEIERETRSSLTEAQGLEFKF